MYKIWQLTVTSVVPEI